MVTDKQPRLTDVQMRAMRIASRYEVRRGDKLGATAEALQDLVERGYLERVGTVNHIRYYKLTSSGKAVLRR